MKKIFSHIFNLIRCKGQFFGFVLMNEDYTCFERNDIWNYFSCLFILPAESQNKIKFENDPRKYQYKGRWLVVYFDQCLGAALVEILIFKFFFN